ncbi:MAG: hypothetical protein K2I96_20540 [Lachnospiraceae bacterium]|nr:hypothetical protein [Lachnospiraceae bacterium]
MGIFAQTVGSICLHQEGDDEDIYKGLTLWEPNVNIFRDPRWGAGMRRSARPRISQAGSVCAISWDCRDTMKSI